MSRPPTHEYADALPDGPGRGRGAGLNPANRFEPVRLHVLGEHFDRARAESDDNATPPARPTDILADTSRSILNPVDSPDLWFKWTVNPYRGCEHGCIYCYARPGHEYLSMSCGLDFETRILAKHDAPALLRRELARPSWRGESVILSGVTDPYQPIERELRLTRRCLEVMAECRQPVSIITKSALVTRDLDLLGELHAHRAAHVSISLTTLDPRLAAKMEPRAASPAQRLRAIREVAAAGIPVCVMTAPIIPGINDHEIPELLRAAADAGATNAGYIFLRLPRQVEALFREWLHRHFPGRAAHVESLLRQSRDGQLSGSEFFTRFTGTGPVAEHIRQTHALFRKRVGLDRPWGGLSSAAFRRPNDAVQPGLFDDR